MTGAIKAITTTGATIAGMRVLSGMPLDGVEEVCDGGAVCTTVIDDLTVDGAMVVVNAAAEVIDSGPDGDNVMTETPMVEVRRGAPSSRLNCVLSIADVTVVGYKPPAVGGALICAGRVVGSDGA